MSAVVLRFGARTAARAAADESFERSLNLVNLSISQTPRRRHSEILRALDSAAKLMLGNPTCAFSFRHQLEDLRAELAAAVDNPLLGQHPIGPQCDVLLQCLLGMARDFDEKRWAINAAAFAPWVTEEHHAALNADLAEMRDRS